MTRIFRLMRRLIILALILIAIIIGAAVYYIEYKLPDINALNTVQLQVPLQIFTKDGKLIATFGEKRRIPLPYSQIPTKLIEAVLATEDQRYFQHKGVDVPGLGRAAVQLILTGRKLQGGSTITMQVARSFYLSRRKTFGRKLREILLAIKIEHKLTKEKILELYLNKVFLGNRAFGVGAAAEVYYGKSINNLSLDEYAMIAGLPKAPSNLNPLANRKAALKRRDHVLSRMLEQGYIDQAAYDKAIKQPINATYHDLKTELKAPYVAELARTQLEQMYGDSIYTDNFKVYTTIDSRLQKLANVAVQDNLIAYDHRHGYRGATQNLGDTSLETMDKWEVLLKTMPISNGLEPAAVIEMTAKTIVVLRATGDITTINWDGLAWARKQVDANFLGPKPTAANQIVKIGDVVRIISTAEGYELAQLPKVEAALVALNPNNGSIQALVGGFDYQSSKFNRITGAQRQPGSSFKPFVYSAALEKGFTLATIINDAPVVIENSNDNSLWRPQNNSRKFYGPTRIRTALSESRNLVSIRILALMGLPYTVEYLKNFGFSPTQLPPGLSLALGTAMVSPLQMAQAYAVFANNGYRVTPYIIHTIKNSNNEIIYKAKPTCSGECDDDSPKAARVISAANTYLITSTLRDVIKHAIAKTSYKDRHDMAGKTGTTQNQVDAWFAGYNPNLVTIAWMGFDQPQSLHEYGAQAAFPMWMQFMDQALKNEPEVTLMQAPEIVSIRINPTTGKRVTAMESHGVFEYFMKPFLPEEESSSDIGNAVTNPYSSGSGASEGDSSQGLY